MAERERERARKQVEKIGKFHMDFEICLGAAINFKVNGLTLSHDYDDLFGREQNTHQCFFCSLLFFPFLHIFGIEQINYDRKLQRGAQFIAHTISA